MSEPKNLSLSNFNLPISYTLKKKDLDNNIIENLELTTSSGENKPLYEIILNPKDKYSKDVIKLWSSNFSYDKKFIKDTQNFIKKFKNTNNNENDKVNIENENDNNKKDKVNNENEEETNNYLDLKKEVGEIHENITNCKFFKEKYQFIDFKILEGLNYSPKILEILTIYNLSTPVITLLTPIIMLIVPFLILKLKKLPISLTSYLDHLKIVFKKHAIGPLISGEFSKIPNDKKIFIGISLVFYIFQIYNNIKSCLAFNKNMIEIDTYYTKFRKYITYSIGQIENFYKYSKNLFSYSNFNSNLQETLTFLKSFNLELNSIKNYSLNPAKIADFGNTLALFYKIKYQQNYLTSLKYILHFNSYIEHIETLQINLKKKQISFSKNSNKTEFKNIYYPALIDEKPIKNNVSLDKHLIVTGPNAAGKTTLLKSILINILLNQQFGLGYYSCGKLKIYENIQCYINIPDTNGRDSLFQAEARQCKKILDLVVKNKNKNNLCVFDELYSGTNPYEAISSSFSFIKYLNQFENMNLVLTTHYIDLCSKLESENNIKNCHMEIKEDNDNFSYTYKLKDGISFIKGGSKVLNDLNYPKEMINDVNGLVGKINL